MRNYKNSSSSRNNIFIICFIVIAIASVIVCIIAQNALEKASSNHSADNSKVQNYETEYSDTVIPDDDSKDTEDTAETRPDFTKMIGFPDYNEIDGLNNIVVAGENNTCMVSLSDLADEKDIIESLTFVFRAENGVSNLGQVKLGFGISVDESCPDATNDSWYQTPGELLYSSDGSYCTALWNIPENLREYVNNSGNVLFGYWWGDYNRVVLEKVLCDKISYKEIQSDGTNENSINVSLAQENGNPSECSVTVPLSSVIDADKVLQRVGIKLKTSSGSLTNFDYSLGITTRIKSDDNYYYCNNKLADTGSNEAEINWIIPDIVKNLYDPEGDLYIKLIGENADKIIIESVIVDYTDT